MTVGATALVRDPRVSILREFFRHLQSWRCLYQDHGVDLLTAPDGSQWSLWDIEYLVREGLPLISPRQRQAIVLFLIEDERESDAARMMGISPTNPVGMYATDGIAAILDRVDAGELPMFRREDRGDQVA